MLQDCFVRTAALMHACRATLQLASFAAGLGAHFGCPPALPLGPHKASPTQNKDTRRPYSHRLLCIYRPRLQPRQAPVRVAPSNNRAANLSRHHPTRYTTKHLCHSLDATLSQRQTVNDFLLLLYSSGRLKESQPALQHLYISWRRLRSGTTIPSGDFHDFEARCL